MIKVAVCMSAGNPRREWDVRFYIQTMQRLAENRDIVWILLGSGYSSEKYAAQVLEDLKNIEVLNLVNKTTLRQMGAVLRHCDMYLGGDTGPMHFASAVRLRGVVLSCHPVNADEGHANAPERFGPWQSEMTILRPEPLPGCEHGCNATYAHCINQIRVDDVVKSMEKIIREYMVGRVGDAGK